MTGTHVSRAVFFVAAIACVTTIGVGLRGGIPAAQAQERDATPKVVKVVNATADPFDVEVVAKVAVQQDPFSDIVKANADEGSGLGAIRWTATERRISEALSRPTSISYLDLSLRDVASDLSKQHDIQIVIDRVSLEEAAIDVDTPITCELADIMLSNALRIMLRDEDLECIIEHEVLVITTVERASATMNTGVYRVGQEHPPNFDALIEVITSTVEPDSWDEVGGDGHIGVYNNALVIRATQRVHKQIDALLRQLNVAYDE